MYRVFVPDTRFSEFRNYSHNAFEIAVMCSIGEIIPLHYFRQ